MSSQQQLNMLDRLAFQVSALSNEICVGFMNKDHTEFSAKVHRTQDMMFVVADYLRRNGVIELTANGKRIGRLEFTHLTDESCLACGKPAEPGMVASFVDSDSGETKNAPCCIACSGGGNDAPPLPDDDSIPY